MRRHCETPVKGNGNGNTRGAASPERETTTGREVEEAEDCEEQGQPKMSKGVRKSAASVRRHMAKKIAVKIVHSVPVDGI